jgi:carbonic anhydrase
MTAPTRAANDAKTAGLWAFDRPNEWSKRYSNCNPKANRKAPLNIDTSRVSPCSVLCRLSLKYEPSTCSVSLVNNIPTVTFLPNSIIKFKNDFFYLRKMTIHHTSMHTINNGYSDLEICLYHNRNPINDSDGGVILSILLKKGEDYGKANEFLNEFINRMPSNENPIEEDIPVSSDWNPIQLLPEAKSFFYYEGALPYPPCSQNWSIIIFEEIVPVASNIIETIKYIIGPGNKNIRPIQKTPANTTIFYNSNSEFDLNQDLSKEAVDKAIGAITTPEVKALKPASWLKQNIYVIKGIVISLILILMIYVAIKFAKIIVENDLLNKLIIKQLQKKQTRDYEKSQAAIAAQEAAMYGQAAPVAAPVNINNNNNNNNNND